MRTWRITGELQRFQGIGGWYYVEVPAQVSDEFEHNGLIPVIAELGENRWHTSLMPKGEGVLFIAIKAAVRKANGLAEGDSVTVTVEPC